MTATQEDKNKVLIQTLNSITDSIIQLDDRLRRVEEALQSTQDTLLKMFPDELNRSDIGDCNCGHDPCEC